MFKSLLRFVGIFIFIGVFASSAFAACGSNQYTGPQGTCQTCPSDTNWSYWGGTCGNGTFTCHEAAFRATGGPSATTYWCQPLCYGSSYSCIPSGWTLNCGGGTNGLNGCYITKNTSATGCKLNDGSINLVKQVRYISGATYTGTSSNADAYDPKKGVYFLYGDVNQNTWGTASNINYQAMPGYSKKITNGTCTKCTGNTFSPGGDVDECFTCPYGGSPTPVSSPSSDVSGASYYDLWREGLYENEDGNMTLATPGASSSDGTYCLISTTTLSDGSGTYNTGTCTLSASSLSDMLWYNFIVTLDLKVASAGEWVYNLCYTRWGGNPTGQKCWDIDGTEGEDLLKNAIWTISGTNCDQNSYTVVKSNGIPDHIEFICKSIGDVQKVMGGTNMPLYMFSELYED